MSAPEPVVEIEDLRLEFHGETGTVHALRGVDLTLHRGETLGLVGESGCGKTQTALALLRLTGSGATLRGAIRYHRPGAHDRARRSWVDVLRLAPDELRALRGNDVAMIFQEPMASLNPVLPIGEQIVEAIVSHQDTGVELRALDRWALRHGIRTRRYRRAVAAALPRAASMLKSLGIADPARVLRAYPHELSGGMRQRVMIAIAIACDPDVLVADEPTTALDVTIQAQIMALLRDLKARSDASILLITHHLGVVAEMADRIAVMYAGRVVEVGSSASVFRTPRHPYTLGLLESIPDAAGARARELPVIPGSVPDLRDPPSGCAFHPRCPFAFARCRERAPELQDVEGQRVACHLYDADQAPPATLRARRAHGEAPSSPAGASL